MLSFESYKIMAKKVAFIGFAGGGGVRYNPQTPGSASDRNAVEQKDKLIRKPKFQI